jgi:exonuclease III
MDMRFGTWNVRSLYRSGSLKTVARELGKYKLDLEGVQEVRWDKGGTERQRIIHSSMEQGMKIISLGQVFLCIRE